MLDHMSTSNIIRACLTVIMYYLDLLLSAGDITVSNTDVVYAVIYNLMKQANKTK